MKFNKLNKLFMILSIVAVIFGEVDASRPFRPDRAPDSTTIGTSFASTNRSERGRGGRRHQTGRRRSGTSCGRTGCNSVNVRGKVSPGRRSRAVVCRGNACRVATVKRTSGIAGRTVIGRGGRGRVQRRGSRGHYRNFNRGIAL